jgi:hypothetical protein
MGRLAFFYIVEGVQIEVPICHGDSVQTEDHMSLCKAAAAASVVKVKLQPTKMHLRDECTTIILAFLRLLLLFVDAEIRIEEKKRFEFP